MIVPPSVVFDIETEMAQSPYDVEVHCIGLMDANTGIFEFHDQDHIPEAIEILLASDRLVGFNSRGFDVPALLKYVDRGRGRLLKSMMHYDLFYEFQQQYPGKRNNLNNFAKETLSMSKIDTIDSAPQLWKTDFDRFKLYTERDVRLTYMLYLHAIQHGYVWMKFPTRVRFYPETISRIIQYD